MTKTRNKRIWFNVLIYGISVLPLLVFGLVYDRLPERLATHFGVDGQPNGWMDKSDFLLFSVGLLIGVPLLMQFSRRLDPKRENYSKFERAFYIVRLLTSLLISVIFTVSLFYNLGYAVNIQMVVLLGIGVMFLVLGNVTPQFRFNYFMGIRTPWTLSNEEVWRRTHRLAGPFMMIAGVVSLVAAFLPGVVAFWLMGVAVVLAALVPTLYSYWIFRHVSK
ncbi:MAG TPA: SdpI family protein [Bacilli bacterium]|nr:SdpI family protein [Bacilli bacterium]